MAGRKTSVIQLAKLLWNTSISAISDRKVNLAEVDSVALVAHAAGQVPTDVKNWAGNPVASPSVAGVPEVDITHVGGVSTTGATGDGRFPANTDRVDGVALGSHASGQFPADVRSWVGTAPAALGTGNRLDVNVTTNNDKSGIKSVTPYDGGLHSSNDNSDVTISAVASTAKSLIMFRQQGDVTADVPNYFAVADATFTTTTNVNFKHQATLGASAAVSFYVVEIY